MEEATVSKASTAALLAMLQTLAPGALEASSPVREKIAKPLAAIQIDAIEDARQKRLRKAAKSKLTRVIDKNEG